MKVFEKSRRIGISWTEALDAVLGAMASETSTYYCGYNFDMASQFIADCADWAKLTNAVLMGSSDYNPYADIRPYLDEEGILNYRLRFANGKEIVALSSRPENFRSKKGRIVIDECAFHKNIDRLLKAANAITIWGGQVRIISTHDGEANEFNELCEQIRGGDLPYSLHKVTFKDAVADGLYRRICQMHNKEWTLEQEFAWVQDIYALYGVGADEELDVIPARLGKGTVFSEPWFTAVLEVGETYGLVRYVRFWDLAATEKKLTGKEPCFTASVKMAEHRGMIYVLDHAEYQLGPADIDDVLLSTAIADGPGCAVRMELEGGSSGIRDAAHIQRMLHQFDFQAIAPRGDKVRRARPWASALKSGNAKLISGAWNKKFIKRHCEFPEGPKDTVDASSGAYDYFTEFGMHPRDIYTPDSQAATISAATNRLQQLRRKSARGVRRF